MPNQGLLGLGQNAETEPVKTEVTLPPGVTVNPSAATGLGVCSLEQFRQATGEPGTGCPEASKVGTLLAQTPLLEEGIEGSVYLAAPNANPFHSLIALYIVARAPERGILIKQPGEVRADPTTGQLSTSFDGLPPVPYSSFQLALREGPRAPLITPQTCGTYFTEAKLYPFSAPGAPVVNSVPFTISSGAGGGACAASEAQLPNNPSLEAGTSEPFAGAYSPFAFKVARADGSQRFSAIEATLPPGLVGKLAGIPYCPEPALAAAAARSGEGDGALELASPSCPAASQIGIVDVGAGAGSQPLHVQGNAYLAGPYKGAPLSIAIVTPAVAGPFDLGVVVVRTALYVDDSNAQIRAVSDPLPTILEGHPARCPLDLAADQPLQLHAQPDQLRSQGDRRRGHLDPRRGRAAQQPLPGRRLRRPRLQAEAEDQPQGRDQALRPPGAEGGGDLPQAGASTPTSPAPRSRCPTAEFLDQGNLDNVCTQPRAEDPDLPEELDLRPGQGLDAAARQAARRPGLPRRRLRPQAARPGRRTGRPDPDPPARQGRHRPRTGSATPSKPSPTPRSRASCSKCAAARRRGCWKTPKTSAAKSAKATADFVAQNGRRAHFKTPDRDQLRRQEEEVLEGTAPASAPLPLAAPYTRVPKFRSFPERSGISQCAKSALRMPNSRKPALQAAFRRLTFFISLMG